MVVALTIGLKSLKAEYPSAKEIELSSVELKRAIFMQVGHQGNGVVDQQAYGRGPLITLHRGRVVCPTGCGNTFWRSGGLSPAWMQWTRRVITV